jgi:hypothetical protein
MIGPILSHINLVQLIYFIKTPHTDNPWYFWIHMDLTLRKELCIQFCVQSVTVTLSDNYYCQFL